MENIWNKVLVAINPQFLLNCYVFIHSFILICQITN